MAYVGDQDVRTLPDWRSDRDDTGLIPTAYFGIRRVLKFIHEEYNHKDIMITELGGAFNQPVNDMDRVNFYLGHLNQIARAVDEFKAPVKAVHFRLIFILCPEISSVKNSQF